MKNLILLSVICLFIFSCNKEEAIKEVKTQADVQLVNNNQSNKNMRAWNGCDCQGSGGTCVGDVIIWGAKIEQITDVFAELNSVENSSSNVFTNHENFLLEYFSSTTINDVINGDIIVKGNSQCTANTNFMIFENTDELLLKVVPFVE